MIFAEEKNIQLHYITLIGSLFHWVCYCKLKGYARVRNCFSKDCTAKLRVVAKHSTLLINSSYYSTLRELKVMGIIMWVSKCLKVVDYKNHMIHMIEPYEY